MKTKRVGIEEGMDYTINYIDLVPHDHSNQNALKLICIE